MLVPHFLQGMTSEGAMMIACCGNGDLWFGEVVDDGQFTAGLEARAIGDCYDTECVG
jgi:hypothetical protein